MSEPPKVQRFHKFGPYMICDLCGLAVQYCKGHALPELVSPDGDSSTLHQRIVEAQQKQGGR